MTLIAKPNKYFTNNFDTMSKLRLKMGVLGMIGERELGERANPAEPGDNAVKRWWWLNSNIFVIILARDYNIVQCSHSLCHFIWSWLVITVNCYDTVELSWMIKQTNEPEEWDVDCHWGKHGEELGVQMWRILG